MFAHVVPIRRFPRTTGAFDYAIPEDLTVHVGSFVVVPLRGTDVIGLVVGLAETSTVRRVAQVRAVEAAMPSFSEPEVDWLQSLARSLYQSLGSLLYAAIPLPPKRAAALPEPEASPFAFSLTPEEAVGAEELVQRMKQGRYSIVVPRTRRTVLAAIIGILKTTDAPLLVICPDLAVLDTVWQCIEPYAKRRLRWSSQSGKQEAFTAWKALRQGDAHCVVTTRLGALTPVATGTRVMVLDAGDAQYLQQQQNPHYDVRRVLQSRQMLNQEHLVFTGLLPRTEDGVITHDDWRRDSEVSVVDMNVSMRTGPHYLLSKALITSIEAALTREGVGPVVLYYNRKSKEGQESVGNRELANLVKGVFPHQQISVVESGDTIPASGIVIVTRTALHQLPFHQRSVRGLAVVQADHAYLYRGFRSLEQGSRDLRLLADIARISHAPFCIQTWSPKEVHGALESTIDLQARERSVRQLLSYPPHGDLVVVKAKEPHECIATYRRLHPEAFGTDQECLIKVGTGEVIEELLTYPQDCDILVNPDMLIS